MGEGGGKGIGTNARARERRNRVEGGGWGPAPSVAWAGMAGGGASALGSRFFLFFYGTTVPGARPAIVGVFYPLWARTHARCARYGWIACALGGDGGGRKKRERERADNRIYRFSSNPAK